MTFFWFLLYVIAGMGCAYWIFRDGEFRPIDTAVYVITSIVFWPFVVPTWILVRPPSQIKDLTWEKSYAHYKHWQKTHKVKDIGDLTNLDKKLSKGNGQKTSEQEQQEEFFRSTSADHPYVIGSAGRSNSDEFFPERIQEDEYGWDEVDDRNPVVEIGTTKPRDVYSPFRKNRMRHEEIEKSASDELESPRESKPPANQAKIRYRKEPSSFNVPSISDILEESRAPVSKEGTRVFKDSNVRKLIDEGRLRDAYRVSRRMLKVAQELGEEDRAAAYQRYLREIENRLKAAQEKPED